jgi:phage-related protein (TIGR01555 family)
MAARKRKGAAGGGGELVANSGEAVHNGLADLCVGSNGVGIGGGINPTGYGVNGGNPWAPQISNVNTLERNLRYYMVSNFRQMLSQAYVEIGLVQGICDIPVDDGLRGGVELKSKQLDEEQIAELALSLDRDDDLTTVGQAAKWNRLFGGAGILILTDQDPEEPFNLNEVGPDDRLDFRAVDMWELFWDKQNTEGYDPAIQSQDFEFYSYYGEKIHKSRVMRLKGMTAPSFVRPRLRGWGFSVVEILVRSINQYLKATDLGFEVLDEFKLDVYKIKNLTNTLMSPIGSQKVRERMQIANYLKNYQNALIMDSEDDFDHKQLSFAGLAEAMSGIRQQVASDMRMPMLKLFGMPASGMNASDEESLEVYNSMVESQVRNKLKYDILRVCEIKCQKLFGFVPDDLSLTFKPLRVLSAVDEENVKTQKFQRLLQAKQAGELTTEEFRDACNKGGLMDVMLDTSDAALDDVKDEAVESKIDPNMEADGEEEPGADKIDSEKTEPVKNALLVYPFKRFTRVDRARRALNSAAFDRASYEADGGDGWIDPRRVHFFEDPPNVDTALWARGKDASLKAFGQVKWQFVAWWYKKQGGRFS